MADSVLVSGGARGIGFAVAARLGRRGLAPCLFDRSGETLDEAVRELQRLGLHTGAVVGDVSCREDVGRAFDAASRLGALRAVAHCAGVSPTLAPAATIFRVNFSGTRILLDEAANCLPTGSAVVVIASLAGHLSRAGWLDAIGDPTDADAARRIEALSDVADVAYGVSKLAVIELARRRAFDLGRRGIRLNTVSPNITNTPMGRSEIEGHAIIREMVAASPIARVAEPEDVAAAVDFLLGPDASYITGTDLLVDGGCFAVLGGR